MDMEWRGIYLRNGAEIVAQAYEALEQDKVNYKGDFYWYVYRGEEGYAATLEEAKALAVAYYRMSNN